MTDRPPYRVPSMAEILALPWNGRNVVSTFSGCGGSSLGYRMAGCRVLLASEFVPAAQEVYRLNARPGTIVDGRDIRSVSGIDLLTQAGLEPGELDILDGSPPCAAFSSAGSGAREWGKVRNYSDTQQRVDDLFYEFTRLLGEMQPRMFVAENVAGLLRGSAKGYFKRIFREMESKGYRLRASVLDSSWLGVPQARRRVIFVGVRSDLPAAPEFPAPLPYRYGLVDALPHIDGFDLAVKTVSREPKMVDQSAPAPVVTATGINGTAYGESAFVARKFGDSSRTVKYRNNRPAPTVMAGGIAGVSYDQAGIVTAMSVPGFVDLVDGEPVDPETGMGLSQAGLALAKHFPGVPLRRLSIAEVRRLCSFPDDFKLAGSYSARWERLGRAVPPMMMFHIAKSVVRTLESCAV